MRQLAPDDRTDPSSAGCPLSDTRTVSPAASWAHRMPQAYGDWLSDFSWDAWLTLTFKQARGSSEAAWRAWDWYLRKQAKDLHNRPSWFAGLEIGRLGRLHIHALQTVEPSSQLGDGYVKGLSALWALGYDRIESYDPERGAGHYLAKYVSKGLADYRVGGDTWQTRDTGSGRLSYSTLSGGDSPTPRRKRTRRSHTGTSRYSAQCQPSPAAIEIQRIKPS